MDLNASRGLGTVISTQHWAQHKSSESLRHTQSPESRSLGLTFSFTRCSYSYWGNQIGESLFKGHMLPGKPGPFWVLSLLNKRILKQTQKGAWGQLASERKVAGQASCESWQLPGGGRWERGRESKPCPFKIGSGKSRQAQ